MERGAKKLINQPEDVVEQSVQGLLAASPRHLRRLEGLHVIVRSDVEVTFLLLFLNSTPRACSSSLISGGEGSRFGGATVGRRLRT